MTTFNGRIATEFKNYLTAIDFIYLDGPDQFNVISNINGINTRHKDMVPMSCDISSNISLIQYNNVLMEKIYLFSLRKIFKIIGLINTLMF